MQMGKLADQITADCCGSLLDDKAQLVKDVAALELKAYRLSKRVTKLTKRILICNTERDVLYKEFRDSTDTRSTCRTVFDTMYKADPKHKEQVWANLCLTLGIEA
jgi:hypothetical protein